MKFIIRTRVYDTETAKKIGDTVNNTSPYWNVWTATLYKRSQNDFFLVGDGLKNMNVYGGFEHTPIKLLNRENACIWAAEWLPSAVVEEEFSDILQYN